MPQCGRCAKARLHCNGPQDIAILSFKGEANAFEAITNPVRHHDHVSSCVRTAVLQALPKPGVYLSTDAQRDELFIAFTLFNLLPTQDELGVQPGTISAECTLALATTYFGMKRQEQAIVQLGLKRYSKALRSVHTTMMNPVKVKSFELVESAMIMALIEVELSLPIGENPKLMFYSSLHQTEKMDGSIMLADWKNF